MRVEQVKGTVEARPNSDNRRVLPEPLPCPVGCTPRRLLPDVEASSKPVVAVVALFDDSFQQVRDSSGLRAMKADDLGRQLYQVRSSIESYHQSSCS